MPGCGQQAEGPAETWQAVNVTGAREKIGLVPFAGHLLRSNGLPFLLVSTIGFGLFLTGVLVGCFWGLVAHDVQLSSNGLY